MALFETKKAYAAETEGKKEQRDVLQEADPTKRMGEFRKKQGTASEQVYATSQAGHAEIDAKEARGVLTPEQARAAHEELDQQTMGTVGKQATDIVSAEEQIVQGQINNMTNQIAEDYRFQRQAAQTDAQIIGEYLKTLSDMSGAAAKVAGGLITGVPTG